jgi:hypothetical protein
VTVAELIQWLSTRPAGATVYLNDPDTGWYMPLHTGVSPDNPGGDPPQDVVVVVHARYGEQINRL